METIAQPALAARVGKHPLYGLQLEVLEGFCVGLSIQLHPSAHVMHAVLTFEGALPSAVGILGHDAHPLSLSESHSASIPAM